MCVNEEMMTYGRCKGCDSMIGALTVQKSSVICEGYENPHIMCKNCQRAGCPNCGGKLGKVSRDPFVV